MSKRRRKGTEEWFTERRFRNVPQKRVTQSEGLPSAAREPEANPRPSNAAFEGFREEKQEEGNRPQRLRRNAGMQRGEAEER